jgi:hypothetical protein
MKLKKLYNEIKLYTPATPYTRQDFNNILSEIEEKLGYKLEDLRTEDEINKYPGRIYWEGKPKYFQYGTLFKDAISFSFHINNINEEEKQIIKDILNNSARKHNFFKKGKDGENNGWIDFHFYDDNTIPNIRIGINFRWISTSGGQI